MLRKTALLATVIALVLLGAAVAGARPRADAGAGEGVVVGVRGTQLFRLGRPYQVYGFNLDFADVHPNLDYLDDPLPERLAALRASFLTARRIGANTVRVFVELRQVMATPTELRPEGLRALGKTIREAERDGVMLDVTGDLVWHVDRSPAWYEGLPEQQRWSVQARFWRAVAAVGAGSPNVLCYELTNEPNIGDSPVWYDGLIGHPYIQYVVRELRGRDPVALARSWTRRMRAAVRAGDPDHLITIGLLPWRHAPFDPSNVADLLDFISVHVYAPAGGAGFARRTVRYFASQDRPLVLGETYLYDRATQAAFLRSARPWLDGTLSFFDGRTPEAASGSTLRDVWYRQNLLQFLSLRPTLGASKAPAPSP